MKSEVILLYAKPYEFVDEETKEKKSGISMSYYFNAELTPQYGANGDVGVRPAKCSVPISCIGKIKAAPALYLADFDMSVDAKGKPFLQLQDLDFVSELMLTPVQPDAGGGAKPAAAKA